MFDRAWVVVALCGLVTVGSVLFLATNFKINTDTEDMLSEDLPFRQNNKAMDAAFPRFEENILLVLQGRTPDQVDAAGDALAARVRAELDRPEAVFSAMLDVRGDPILQANGLLLLSEAELEALTERLAAAQPFLASLWGDASLGTLSNLIADALEQQAKGDTLPVPLADVLNDLAEVLEQRQRGDTHAVLSWRRLIDRENAGDPQRLILIEPKLDYASLNPGKAALTRLNELRQELGFEGNGPVSLRFTGSAALKQEELGSVRDGIGLAGLLSFVLVIIILGAGLRSARLVGTILISLIVGLLWTAGFAILVVGTLNLISVAFAVLFVGLSVDFGIHYVMRYQEGFSQGDDQRDALIRAGVGVGGALCLCAVTAAIAFYAFLPTAYIGLAELGLIAGSGMFIALFINLTLVPALIRLMPAQPMAQRSSGVLVSFLNRWIQRRAVLVLGVAGLIAVLSATQVSNLTFDFDPLNLRERETESVSTLMQLAEDQATSPYVAEVLAPSLEAATDLARALEDLPEVAGTATLSRFLPEGDLAEKTLLLEDLAFLLGPSLPAGGGVLAANPTADTAGLDRLRQGLAAVTEDPTRLGAAAQRLSNALEGQSALSHDGLSEAWLSTFPDAANRLRRSLGAEPYGIADLSPTLRERYLAEDGHARVHIFPTEDLRDHLSLVRFVEAVEAVAPTSTGPPFTIQAGTAAVMEAFAFAFAFAVTVIFVLLIVLLRSIRDALIIFAPLALATLVTIWLSAALSLPFNFANVIVLPLLFGLSVDYGIHLVLRAREECASDSSGDAFETTTPQAVVISAMTTIGSFGSIALSAHPGTASMGVLLTIAIAVAVISTFVLLPALIKVCGVSQTIR